jgi:hypothetical protein
MCSINPLPHGVLATFFLTAGGFMSPPIKDDISRETTIFMTSLRTHGTSAVSSPGLYYNYPPLPLPLRGHCILYLAPLFISQLSRQLFEGKRVETYCLVLLCFEGKSFLLKKGTSCSNVKGNPFDKRKGIDK